MGLADARTLSRIRRALLRAYDRQNRDLPWRQTKDPYCIWVSEVMLQQTRVETVLEHYARWMAALPTLDALAAAPQSRVLKLWEGNGYYARARNLHAAARLLVREHGGDYPRTAQAWQALPGVGPYIAAAVSSIAFDYPAAVVDGNVLRVLARLFALDEDITATAGKRRVQELADALLDRKRPGDFNQALMEFGATICRPRNPECGSCSLQGDCMAFATGDPTRFPIKARKKPVPSAEVAAAVIKRNGRLLIAQRPPKGLLGGLWEFPGGKRERGESWEACLRREIREELGTEIEVGAMLREVHHAYTHLKVTLRFFECELSDANALPRALEHTALKWVWPSQLKNYAFPVANRPVISDLT